MAETMSTNPSDVQSAAEIHLLVFVHGLWGNPAHLSNVVDAVSERFPSGKQVHTLVCKRNAGSFTYDGIDVGGERVTQEIEQEIASLNSATPPRRVNKISIVGYSLGGLIARYAIGLLETRGILNGLDTVNFTTFATPHLGVRTPSTGWSHSLFNTLGGATLCASGAQLFTIDTFRDTGRCLLDVLADPAGVFIRGLRRFRNRSIYANIVNDRSVPFYTACISSTDPFIDLDAINIRYAPGYEDVILETEEPAARKPHPATFYESVSNLGRNTWNAMPIYFFFATFAPIGIVAYLVNAGYQTYSSGQRLRMHEEGLLGIEKGQYKLPLMVEELNRAAETALEAAEHSRKEEFLQPGSSSATVVDKSRLPDGFETDNVEGLPPNDGPFPTLALTSAQFRMIKNLNELGFQKYPVHIHKARHSHAAIVVRMNRDSFSEGRIVSRHWVERLEL